MRAPNYCNFLRLGNSKVVSGSPPRKENSARQFERTNMPVQAERDPCVLPKKQICACAFAAHGTH